MLITGLVTPRRFERPTYGLGIRRSILQSYGINYLNSARAATLPSPPYFLMKYSKIIPLITPSKTNHNGDEKALFKPTILTKISCSKSYENKTISKFIHAPISPDKNHQGSFILSTG